MKKILLFSMLAIFVLSSCTKRVTKVVHEDAPNNAQGIVYSVMPEDWAYDGDTVLTASFDVPELTDKIFDHGAVIVYLSRVDDMFEALPQVFDYTSYNALHFPGLVTIELRDIDPSFPVYPPNVEIYIKIVLIDAEAVMAHPQLDLTNYAEVKNTFQLNELKR